MGLVRASVCCLLCQGDLPRALPLLERAMGICQEAALPLFVPRVAAALGAAHTLSGRVADAVALLTPAMEQTMATDMAGFQALCSLPLGEAHLLAGRLEEAHALAEQALALTRAHQELGNQAYALRLLGEIAARRDPPEGDLAAAYYQEALALADDTRHAPAHGPLPPGARHAVCRDRSAGAGSHRAVHCHRAVPGHGHGILAAPGGGCTGAGGGAVKMALRLILQVVSMGLKSTPRTEEYRVDSGPLFGETVGV